MRTLVVFTVVAVASALAGDYFLSLNGLHGFRVKCDNELDLLKAKSFDGVNGFDVMRIPRVIGETLDVLVEADKVDFFQNYLLINGIEHEVFTKDFRSLLEKSTHKQHNLRFSAPPSSYNFQYFPRHSEINDYLESLSTKYGGLITLINIGKSYERRDMLAVKFSTGDGVKPVVFIDAGIHAREWIAPTTALYIINELVNPSNRHLLDQVDVVVVPTINPDGYEFSHTTYRMWRKTRGKNPRTSGCTGVDMNRNFGFKWNVIGASQNPCSDIYSGPEPFSEIESRNVRDFILSLNGTVKVYLSLHAYGQMMLHPWGWTKKLPENEPELRSVGMAAAEAIKKVRGKVYVVGSSTVVLYAASGGSDDWAMAVGKANLAYTMELPRGKGGFVIDPEEIEPVGFETFQGVKEFIAYAASAA